MVRASSEDLLQPASPPLRILVVEDEFIIANDIERCLEEAGYQVPAISSSGERAIELAERLKPDLVLMDIQLPGELDGISAATAIRERLGLPVVYLTAQSDPATLARAKVSGPFGYVVKPFSEKALYGAIETAIAKHAMERQVLESERWLSVVLGNLDDGILVLDEGYRVTMVNPVAEELLGRSREQIVGRSVTDVATIEHDVSCERLDWLNYDPANATDAHNAFVLRSFAGRTIPVELRVSPLPSSQGKAGGLLVQLQDVTDRRAAERKIRHLALHDSLTGLSNRVLAFDRIEMLIAQAQRRGTKVGVAFVDLDYFKEINDTHGHEQGDVYLQEIAKRLKRGRRAADTVARLGGDEFLLLFGDLHDVDDLRAAVEGVLEELQEPISLAGQAVGPSASVGVSLFPDDAEDAEGLIRKADQAMYHAKRTGRGRYCFVAERG